MMRVAVASEKSGPPREWYWFRPWNSKDIMRHKRTTWYGTEEGIAAFIFSPGVPDEIYTLSL